jgi:hypothetical protein
VEALQFDGCDRDLESFDPKVQETFKKAIIRIKQDAMDFQTMFRKEPGGVLRSTFSNEHIVAATHYPDLNVLLLVRAFANHGDWDSWLDYRKPDSIKTQQQTEWSSFAEANNKKEMIGGSR